MQTETMTTDDLARSIEENDEKMGEAIRDLKEAKKARAEAIADGADPDTAGREVSQITERLEGLTAAAEVLQQRYEEAEARERHEKAERDLALIVEEAEELADGYEDAIHEAQEAAEAYVEKASVALSARARSKRLHQTAKILCEMYGLDMPDVPVITATDKRRDEILNAYHRIDQGDAYAGAVRNLRLAETHSSNSRNGAGQEAEDRLRSEVDRVVGELMA